MYLLVDVFSLGIRTVWRT